mgnify:CR=1 FL=1
MIAITIVGMAVLAYVMLDMLDGNRVKDKTYTKVKGNIIHSDEPLFCPLCSREFYRWEWEKAYKRDPEFRTKYYNHVLKNGMYHLPCPTCAQSKVEEIKRINGEAWNEGARQWNKLTQKERKEMHYQNYMATTSATPEPKYFPDRKLWKPGDD